MTFNLGITKSIFYTILSRIIQGVGGVLTVFVVSNKLSEIEQGFYFTFGSILAIQVFFELGMNSVITQYVAHDSAHVEIVDGKFTGEYEFISRLSSLIHFCFKWYGFLGIFLFILLSIGGCVFFSVYHNTQEQVVWFLPWLLLCLGTSITFLVSPIIAIIEGLGKVEEVARIRLFQQIVFMIFLWCGLLIGFKLYVGGLGILISVIGLIFLLWRKYKTLFLNLYNVEITVGVSYKREIFPYQWKIAVSWISGYFIFQLFNPVLFATNGATVAGQMGLTLTVLNAIQAFANSWYTTKIPIYAGLISKGEFSNLDDLFRITVRQSSTVCAFLMLGVLVVVLLFDFYSVSLNGVYLSKRFLEFKLIVLMMIPTFLNHIVFSWATYLRCHKKEPYLIISVFSGILIGSSTLFMANIYGVYGVAAGYCIITVLMFFMSYRIYKRRKNEWHT
jgi:O-antigen/teichoic acid export membrane protein